MQSPRLARTWFAVASVLSLLALGYHARTYLGFFIDDSFISLRYSDRFLHGLGLTWTDGERVEGYSNFLWVVLVAGAGAFFRDLIDAARLVGGSSSALAVLGLVWASWRRARSPGAALGGAYAGLAFAATGPLASWTVGGLEQPLLVGLLCWAYVLTDVALERDAGSRPLTAAAILLGLSCLVRPDGFLFALAAAFGCIVAAGFGAANLRRAGTLLAIPALFEAAHTLFRRLYYGDWVPNTYYAKGAFSWERVRIGWGYVSETFTTLGALYAVVPVALLFALWHRDARRSMTIPLVACVGWTAYVVRIGGDICPQHRHLTVTLALACLLLAQLCSFAWQRPSRVGRTLAVLVGPLLLASLAYGQREDPARARALADNWHWSGRPVGTMLATAFAKERPLLAVDAAGALPFYYSLPCLDMLGLNDRYIARHPPPGIGTGYTGHELGDGKYVLSRKPDLVAFWTPIGGDRPQWRSGREMVREPSFHAFYQAVTFQADAHTRTRLWVRRIDGPIGMQVTPERVVVPAYLLDAGRETAAFISARGRLAITLAARRSAQLRDLPLSPGAWALEVVGSSAPRMELRVARHEPIEVSEGAAFVVPASDLGLPSLRLVAPSDHPVVLESLVFVRHAQ